MAVNVEIKADANRAMENKKTRTFTFIVIGTVLITCLLIVFIVWIEGSNGKNAESPFLKITNPSKDSSKIIIDQSVHDDHSTKLNINKVEGDIIRGNKVVNYNNAGASSK
jgi:hypothetical protein